MLTQHCLCFFRPCLHPQVQVVKCLNSPLSLLPPRCLGMRSLIRYGLEAAFAVTLCNAVAMPFNMSSLPLAVSFSSLRTCCISSAISCLTCCCKWTMSAAVTMPALLRLLLLRNLKSPLQAPLATTLGGAPLSCRTEVCFVGTVTRVADKCVL